MTGRIKNVNASQRVLAYLRENSNTDIPAIEIANATGLPSTPIHNAVVHLRGKGVNITRPSRGIYRYNSGPVEPVPSEIPTQKLYEYIGNSGGVTIVKGEDDELYVVTPLVEFITRQP